MQYLITRPAYQVQVEFIRDNPDDFRRAVDAAEVANQCKVASEKAAAVPITVVDAVEKLRDLRNRCREEYYRPWLSLLLHSLVMRRSVDVLRSVSDRGAYLLLAMVDDRDLEDAAGDLIAPDGCISEAEIIAEKKRLERDRRDALELIRETVPAEILNGFDGDLFRSDLWRAYDGWRDKLRASRAPCDPWGMRLTDENRYRTAFEVLNLERFIGDPETARYIPADFDPRFNQ
jgi:hypothetical protein